VSCWGDSPDGGREVRDRVRMVVYLLAILVGLFAGILLRFAILGP
jgi:hypothetical protein